MELGAQRMLEASMGSRFRNWPSGDGRMALCTGVFVAGFGRKGSAKWSGIH